LNHAKDVKYYSLQCKREFQDEKVTGVVDLGFADVQNITHFIIGKKIRSQTTQSEQEQCCGGASNFHCAPSQAILPRISLRYDRTST